MINSKEFSKLSEIEQKSLVEYWQRTAKGEAISEHDMNILLKNISKENNEKYILYPTNKII